MIGLIINIFIHVFILFIFLTILYFTVISTEEKNIVNDQLNKLIHSNLYSIFSQIKKKINPHPSS